MQKAKLLMRASLHTSAEVGAHPAQELQAAHHRTQVQELLQDTGV